MYVGLGRKCIPLGVIHEAGDETAATVACSQPAACSCISGASTSQHGAAVGEPMSPGSKLGTSPSADVWSLQIRHFTDCVPVDSYPLCLTSSDASDSDMCEGLAPVAAAASFAAAPSISQLADCSCATASIANVGSTALHGAQQQAEETAEERVRRWLMAQGHSEALADECFASCIIKSEGSGPAAKLGLDDVAFDAPDFWTEAVLTRWKQQREQISQSWWLQAKLWAEWAAFKANLYLVG